MRIVAEIPHPRYKITIFKSGYRHLLKFEKGDLEQVYRYQDGEGDLKQIKAMLDIPFLSAVDKIFEQMQSTRKAHLASDSGHPEWDEII